MQDDYPNTNDNPWLTHGDVIRARTKAAIQAICPNPTDEEFVEIRDDDELFFTQERADAVRAHVAAWVKENYPDVKLTQKALEEFLRNRVHYEP